MARVLYTQELQQYLPPGPYGPAYGGESVGLDLYAVEDRTILPAIPGAFGLALGSLYEQPPSQLIPTGIHLVLELGEGGFILERGSVVKTPLKVRAGVIDPGFTGQVFVNCVNLSDRRWEIKAGTKLPFQLVCIPVVRPTTQVVPDINSALAEISSTRGANQVGSSD